MAAPSYGNYPNCSNVKKILVIKLRHLGDVLLTGPVFRTLKRTFPSAQIDAYIYEEALPMLEGHPAISHLLVYPRSWKKLKSYQRFCNELSLLWKIRSRSYDLVINLTEGDRGLIAAKTSGAKIRAGLPPKSKWKKKWLTHMVKECPSLRHTVEKNLDVLRKIGIFPDFEDKELDFQIPELAEEKAILRVGKDPFVLIHPTSRWKFKCWPPFKVRALIERLLDAGHRVVVSAGSDSQEKEMAAKICEDLAVINLAGEVTLKELGALIQKAELLICVDSLPFHLASALKKPVVALFGPTSDQTWGPWRNPHALVVASPFSCRPCYLDGCGGSKRSDCLEALSVEEVWEAVFSRLTVCYSRNSSPK